MATIAVWLNIEEERMVSALQEAGTRVDGTESEVVLDFASVRRIDSPALGALEGLARLAEDKAVKVVLRGVNVHVYKVLKLMKLAPRFLFTACDGRGPATE
jgi:anti-anti-sigma regulatory factor